MPKFKLPILVLLSLMVIAFGLVTSKPYLSTAKSRAPEPIMAIGQKDVPGTIHGANNPELIPDHIAYSAIFRLLSNRHTDDELMKARAYVKQMGLGKHNCKTCPAELDTDESDVDAVLAAAEEFYERISVLDRQVAEIKNRTWPNPTAATMAQLASLQQQREGIAAQVAASLGSRLTPKGMLRVRKYINEHVKQRVNLIPEPMTPPGGEGWQSDHPNH